MHHGIRTKHHLLDPGWDYGELKWLAHHWSKRGQIGNERRAIRLHKRRFARAERRRGKRETQQETQQVER